MGVEYWCSRFELGNGEGERGVEEAGWDFESGITLGKKKGLVNLLNDRESAMKHETEHFWFWLRRCLCYASKCFRKLWCHCQV